MADSAHPAPDQRAPTLALDGQLVRAVADLHQPLTWVERALAAARLLTLASLLTAGAALHWLMPPGLPGVSALLGSYGDALRDDLGG